MLLCLCIYYALTSQCVRRMIKLLWPGDAMTTYNWLSIGSGNSLVPDGIKLLPEPMLTNHWLCSVTVTQGQCQMKSSIF